MTDEDQKKRLRIARVCGWEYTYGSSSDEGFPWRKDATGSHHHDIPDYLNSLDAMHEAVMTLRGKAHSHAGKMKYLDYHDALEEIVMKANSQPGNVSIYSSEASARQRAEAFLMTIKTKGEKQ